MGKIHYFSINLNKKSANFYSDESIIGEIKLIVKQKSEFNSICMVLSGKATVEWADSKIRQRKRIFCANECFLNVKLTFCEKKTNEHINLEAGEYSYPFKILLPSNLPTSFEHDYGQIRYSLIGMIEDTYENKIHTTRSFSLINNVDLNCLYSLNKQPCTVTGTKVLEIFCCLFEPVVNVKLAVLKTSFISGDSINFKVCIENSSKKSFDQIFVSLIQNIKFHAEENTKTVKNILTEVICPNKIKKRTTENWNGHLDIPEVCTSTSFDTCKIIEISYSINLNVDSCKRMFPKLEIPIKIGNIPLDEQLCSKLNESSLFCNSNEDEWEEIEFDSGRQTISFQEESVNS